MAFRPSTLSVLWFFVFSLLVGLDCREKERLFNIFIFERKGASGSEILDLLFREEIPSSVIEGNSSFLMQNNTTLILSFLYGLLCYKAEISAHWKGSAAQWFSLLRIRGVLLSQVQFTSSPEILAVQWKQDTGNDSTWLQLGISTIFAQLDFCRMKICRISVNACLFFLV